MDHNSLNPCILPDLAYLFFKKHNLTTVKIKELGEFENFNDIQEYSIKHERLYTYITLGICKLWIQFEEKTFDILKMLNFEAVSQEIAKDIELMIFSRSKIPLMSVLENRTKIQKLLEPNIIFETAFSQYAILEKPIPGLKIIENPAETQDILEFSNSEETEKMKDLSFRISEAFNQRFPRFSAASITITETPSKENKKSFIEYAEVIESPKINIIETNLKQNLSITPIDSPKQSIFSINEVKHIMTNSNSFDEYFEKLSPTEKFYFERKKKFSPKKCNYDEDLKNSLRTELTSCSELGRARLNCEGKNPNCHCSSCNIM